MANKIATTLCCAAVTLAFGTASAVAGGGGDDQWGFQKCADTYQDYEKAVAKGNDKKAKKLNRKLKKHCSG